MRLAVEEGDGLRIEQLLDVRRIRAGPLDVSVVEQDRKGFRADEACGGLAEHGDAEHRGGLVRDTHLVEEIFVEVANHRRVRPLADARMRLLDGPLERPRVPRSGSARLLAHETGLAVAPRDVDAQRDRGATFHLFRSRIHADPDRGHGRPLRIGDARDGGDRARSSQHRHSGQHGHDDREPLHGLGTPAPCAKAAEGKRGGALGGRPDRVLRECRRIARGNVPSLRLRRDAPELERRQQPVVAVVDEAARLERGIGQRRLGAQHAREREAEGRECGEQEAGAKRPVLGTVERQEERQNEPQTRQGDEAQDGDDARALDRAPQEEPPRAPELAKQRFVGSVHGFLNGSPRRSRH